MVLKVKLGPSCWSSPDSKVHGANMGLTWVLSAPDGPHVGPMNFDIWVQTNGNKVHGFDIVP